MKGFKGWNGKLGRRQVLKAGAVAAAAALGGPVLGGPALAGGRAGDPLAVFINLADTHSPYDNYPRMLTLIERIVRAHEGVPTYILFNGDLFELGNVVAARSRGEVDWVFLQALSSLAPVIVNIGNHEFDFMSPRDFVTTAERAGVRVIGNVLERPGGERLTPTVATLRESGYTLDVVGVATDQLGTYEASSRPLLLLPRPAPWVNETYDRLTLLGDWSVLLSHAGVVADREMFAALPQGTLVVGGHNHLVLRETVGRGVTYMHNGFRGERLNVTVARLEGAGVTLSFEDYPLDAGVTAEPGLAALVEEVRGAHLQAEDLAAVGTVPRDYTVLEAAQWAVDALREASGADVAMLNHTSFGAGLQAGPLPKYRFDEFLRFDNEVVRTEVDGETLAGILRLANQGPDTPLEARTGDFVYTSDIAPQPGRTYTLVTSSWVATPFNVGNYLGTTDLLFETVAGVTTKGLLAAALSR